MESEYIFVNSNGIQESIYFWAVERIILKPGMQSKCLKSKKWKNGDEKDENILIVPANLVQNFDGAYHAMVHKISLAPYDESRK